MDLAELIYLLTYENYKSSRLIIIRLPSSSIYEIFTKIPKLFNGKRCNFTIVGFQGLIFSEVITSTNAQKDAIYLHYSQSEFITLVNSNVYKCCKCRLPKSLWFKYERSNTSYQLPYICFKNKHIIDCKEKFHIHKTDNRNCLILPDGNLVCAGCNCDIVANPCLLFEGNYYHTSCHPAQCKTNNSQWIYRVPLSMYSNPLIMKMILVLANNRIDGYKCGKYKIHHFTREMDMYEKGEIKSTTIFTKNKRIPRNGSYRIYFQCSHFFE